MATLKPGTKTLTVGGPTYSFATGGGTGTGTLTLSNTVFTATNVVYHYNPQAFQTYTYVQVAPGTPIGQVGNGYTHQPGPAHNKGFPERPQVRVEKPRSRTVFLRGHPVRLAFPWTVFAEWPQQMWAWVSPDEPTWDSTLYQFPLTWHIRGGLGRGDIQSYSHFASTGLVCFGGSTWSGAQQQNIENNPGLLFWGSNFMHWDEAFVEAWKIGKADPVRNFKMDRTLRQFCAAFHHGHPSYSEWEFEEDELPPLNIGRATPLPFYHMSDDFWIPHGTTRKKMKESWKKLALAWNPSPEPEGA